MDPVVRVGPEGRVPRAAGIQPGDAEPQASDEDLPVGLDRDAVCRVGLGGGEPGVDGPVGIQARIATAILAADAGEVACNQHFSIRLEREGINVARHFGRECRFQ